VQPAVGDPAWAGVGLGDPQRSLQPLLFCDSVKADTRLQKDLTMLGDEPVT